MAQHTKLQHLAVIMDGNGRWAQMKGLPRSAGHAAGVKAARRLLESCHKHQITHLTLFAFSSENWKRPQNEVGMLMDLFIRTFDKELPLLLENNVKLAFIGDISAFDEKLQKKMLETSLQTSANNGLRLNIAVNYGGRLDITLAAKKMIEDIYSQSLAADQITPERFSEYVCLADSPDPDLLIRTGGEYRVSNFLLWQMAYTELYFTDLLWPDFDESALAKAVEWYFGRERRFGETSEQTKAKLKQIKHA